MYGHGEDSSGEQRDALISNMEALTEQVFAACEAAVETEFDPNGEIPVAMLDSYVAARKALEAELAAGKTIDDIVIDAREIVPKDTEVMVHTPEEYAYILEQAYLAIHAKDGSLPDELRLAMAVQKTLDHELAHKTRLETFDTITDVQFCIAFYINAQTKQYTFLPSVQYEGSLTLRQLIETSGEPVEQSPTDAIISSILETNSKEES
jgi:hypothetical protein